MDNRGCLYLCPTPIGNLEDITLRVLRVLKEVDLIAAEDTRVTAKLLNHYEIKTPLTSYHEHNKKSRGHKLISLLCDGKAIALVSDAGTPGLSDPGEDLVKQAVEKGIKIVPLPGAAAAITALVGSGLSTKRFAFEGFLPAKDSQRKKLLEKLVSEERTLIFYESPYRVIKTLKDIKDVMGNRQVVVAREITKVHEEFIRGNVEKVIREFEHKAPKGEMVIVVEGVCGLKETDEDFLKKLQVSEKELAQKLKENIQELMELEGISRNTALKKAAKAFGLTRNRAYELLLKNDVK